MTSKKPPDCALASAVQHGRCSEPLNGSRRLSFAQYPTPPTNEGRYITHVPQLVAERSHRKQRVESDWRVPQFGQRHIDIEAQSTLGADLFCEQIDLRPGRHELARQRVLLRDEPRIQRLVREDAAQRQPLVDEQSLDGREGVAAR